MRALIVAAPLALALVPDAELPAAGAEAAAGTDAGALGIDSGPAAGEVGVAEPAGTVTSSARAIISSSCRRGAVAPAMLSSASATVSAMRESWPGAKPCACSNMRCS